MTGDSDLASAWVGNWEWEIPPHTYLPASLVDVVRVLPCNSGRNSDDGSRARFNGKQRWSEKYLEIRLEIRITLHREANQLTGRLLHVGETVNCSVPSSNSKN